MPVRSVHDQTKKIQSRVQARSCQTDPSAGYHALEIGVAPNLLSRWKREAEAIRSKAFQGSGNPRDEEVARLKRELVRVTKERDFCGKRRRTSPRARPEISGYSTLSRLISHTPYVSVPEGICQWLLRLGIAYTQQAADRERSYRCPDEGDA